MQLVREEKQAYLSAFSHGSKLSCGHVVHPPHLRVENSLESDKTSVACCAGCHPTAPGSSVPLVTRGEYDSRGSRESVRDGVLQRGVHLL